MWIGEDIAIEVQRNAIKKIGITFLNQDTRLPVDLSGYSFVCKIKKAAGASEVVGLASISATNLAKGTINIVFDGMQLNYLPGAMEQVILCYDVLVNDGSGPQVIMRGPLILSPGVS